MWNGKIYIIKLEGRKETKIVLSPLFVTSSISVKLQRTPNSGKPAISSEDSYSSKNSTPSIFFKFLPFFLHHVRTRYPDLPTYPLLPHYSLFPLSHSLSLTHTHTHTLSLYHSLHRWGWPNGRWEVEGYVRVCVGAGVGWVALGTKMQPRDE